MTRRRGKGSLPASPAPAPPGTVVHDRTVEAREKSQRAVYGPRPTHLVHRAVCSCGWSTRWHRDLAATNRAADAHAVAGQLGLDLGELDARS